MKDEDEPSGDAAPPDRGDREDGRHREDDRQRRDERLAEALRANLRRRKEQGRPRPAASRTLLDGGFED